MLPDSTIRSKHKEFDLTSSLSKLSLIYALKSEHDEWHAIQKHEILMDLQ